ncbi:MAG: hypothetical protein DRP30_03565 [Thermotoga sp.]|nr:MAG: hypothetical protein DRP30_03565 [Thermotoga sp.]
MRKPEISKYLKKRRIQRKLKSREKGRRSMKIVQAFINDGNVDFESLVEKIRTIMKTAKSGETIYITPLIEVSNGDEVIGKLEEIFSELIDESVMEQSFETIVEKDGKFFRVLWEYCGLEVSEYRNSEYYKTKIWELGDTLRHRWLNNMKEAFRYLYATSNEREEYLYLSSEIISGGKVYPGGSFMIENGKIVEEGFHGGIPTDPLELITAMISFYKEVKKKDKALVAVSDGAKSRFILNLLKDTFDHVEAVSFWEKDGCRLAKEFGIKCEMVNLKGRSARLIESYMLLKSMEMDAIAVWGANKDFILRHRVVNPRIFTPLWFLTDGDLEDLGVLTTHFDDILKEII